MEMLFVFLAIQQGAVFKALEIMWKGVLAIFVVIALVIVTTIVVNKLCVKAEEKAKAKEKEAENENK